MKRRRAVQPAEREQAREAVAAWPPLTDEQREALTDLLSPYAPKREGQARHAA